MWIGLLSSSRRFKLSLVSCNLCTQAKKSPNVERMARGLPKKLPIPEVDHVLLVSSGKGGVGKSATSVNLALSLAKVTGSKVGLLDADVYGPSIPKMMNLESQQPEVNHQNVMQPLVNFGVKCMSMGFLVDPSKAIVWRGLMVMQAIERLIRQVTWGPLDYLIIDMPPGTGDTQLSISQTIPVSGAVIVTTPQSISLLDTKRSIDMYNKVNIPILGIVVNMSHFICSKCESKHQLYGPLEAVKKLAQESNTDILIEVPFNPSVMSCNDHGKPIFLSGDEEIMKIYTDLANSVIQKLTKPLN